MSLEFQRATEANASSTSDILQTILSMGQDLAWLCPQVAPFLSAGITLLKFLFGSDSGTEQDPYNTLYNDIKTFVEIQELTALNNRISTCIEFRNMIYKSCQSQNEENLYQLITEPCGYLDQLRNTLGPQEGSLLNVMVTLKDDGDLKPNGNYQNKDYWDRVKLKFSMLLSAMTLYLDFHKMLILLQTYVLNKEAKVASTADFVEMSSRVDEFKTQTSQIKQNIWENRLKMVQATAEAYCSVMFSPSGNSDHFQDDNYRNSPYIGMVKATKGFIWVLYLVADENRKDLIGSDWCSWPDDYHDTTCFLAYTFIDQGCDDDPAIHRVVSDRYYNGWWTPSNQWYSRQAVCETMRQNYLTCILPQSFNVEVGSQADSIVQNWDSAVSYWKDRVTPETPQLGSTGISDWTVQPAPPDTLWAIPTAVVRYGVSFSNQIGGESTISYMGGFQDCKNRANPTISDIPDPVHERETVNIIKVWRQFKKQLQDTAPCSERLVKVLVRDSSGNFPTSFTDTIQANNM